MSAHRGSDEDTHSLSKFLDNLVPLIDDFVGLSPLGQYLSRLEVLHSFELYLGLLATTQDEGTSDALRRAQCVLNSSRLYFSQFETKVTASLSQQRSVIEKDLHSIIKLASWRDVNVQSLKQSAQRSHRQLFKCVRKFREVLRQPVKPLLHPQSKQEDRREPEGAVAFPGLLSIPNPNFPPAITHISRPQHLVNIEVTYRNFSRLLGDQVMPTLCSPTDIESFSFEIVSTIKTLNSVGISANGDPVQRKKIQKNVLSRKRKAWSDLLKELKRCGLPANVNAVVLAQ